MTELLTQFTEDSHEMDENSHDRTVMPNVDRYVGHASSHPRIPLKLSRSELSHYPEISDELVELLVKPDPSKEPGDGIKMLSDLEQYGKEWAAEEIAKGQSDDDAANELVRRIQRDNNVMFDPRAIGNAKAIARDAVLFAQGGRISIKPVEKEAAIGVPLEDGVPSVVAITGPDGGRRHELLTSQEREDLEIHSVEVDEEQLSRDALEKLFGTKETGQGE